MWAYLRWFIEYKVPFYEGSLGLDYNDNHDYTWIILEHHPAGSESQRMPFKPRPIIWTSSKYIIFYHIFKNIRAYMNYFIF